MPAYDDRWWWLCAGVLAVFAVRTVSKQLHEIRDLVQVGEDESRPSVVGRETEDGLYLKLDQPRWNSDCAKALSLATLETLTQGMSFELRVAALKIVFERATRESLGPLLKRAACKDPDVRAPALQVLKVLAQSGTPTPIQALNHPRTFRALVQALRYHVPPHVSSSQLLNRSPHLRPATERNAMYVLARIIPYNVSAALKAGVVARWLSRYPFGATEQETRDAVRLLKSWNAQDMLLSEIICAIEGHPEGRKEMRAAGLTGSAMGEPEDGDDWQVDVWGSRDLGASTGGGLVSGRRRERDESLEEHILRRRRREAMVYSDGVEPLGHDGIIHSQNPDFRRYETDEAAVDREMQRLMDQVTRQEMIDVLPQSTQDSPSWRDAALNWLSFRPTMGTG